MKILRLVYLFSLVALLASCASTLSEDESTAATPKLQAKEFIVSVGERVTFMSSSIEFLDIVNDSRCPKGAQCVNAGQATLSFIYTTPTSAESFNINTSDDSVRQLGGIAIGLVSFEPEPSDDAKLDPQDFDARLIVFEEDALDDVTIIDVRTEGEYNNSHYSGAINLPVDEVAKRIGELDLAKDETFIVYCRSGNRAARAKASLEELGYTNVLNGVNEDSLDKLLD